MKNIGQCCHEISKLSFGLIINQNEHLFQADPQVGDLNCYVEGMGIYFLYYSYDLPSLEALFVKSL